MRKLGQSIGMVVVAGGVVAVGAPSVEAASEVNAGGFLEEGLAAFQSQLSPGGQAADSLQVRSLSDANTRVMTFTPRFAGSPVELLERPSNDTGSILKARLSSPRGTDDGGERALGLFETHSLGAFALDVSAIAEFGATSSDAVDPGSAFALGGGLEISGVRLDASFARDGVSELASNRLSAGIGYGFGSLDTRVSYSRYENELLEEDTRVVRFGSQLTLGEGLVLGGDLAYSNDQVNGSSAAAGVLNFRFNF